MLLCKSDFRVGMDAFPMVNICLDYYFKIQESWVETCHSCDRIGRHPAFPGMEQTF